MISLESDDKLFQEPMSEEDQMLRDVRSDAVSERGGLVELVFDRESSSVSSSIDISDPLKLGYNVHDDMESYIDSTQ